MAAKELASESGAPRFIQRLLLLVPDFAPVYQEHCSYYGELLPHVLMGDFTRWFIALLQRHQAGGPTVTADRVELETVASFLEQELVAGDPSVRDLIGASFLENLWQADDQYEAAKQLLGPSLRTWLAQME